MPDHSTAPVPQPVQIPERADTVGPGWQELLGRLHHQLRAMVPGYRLVDLGEKFGGLRVHVESVGDDGDATRTLITAAEAESMRTCEFCGAPGRVRTREDASRGWRKTVCDTCHGLWSAHHLMIVNGAVRGRPSEA
ncbi:hypothetical protein ACIGXA_23865 [Streptomyces fildesensis]|uniref:GATA-type domain-containing protein n=1 Tax=Streptomyces fildesensis TaxID=375757 RepID=A0ABW8CAV6_9ACTN